MGTNAEKIGLMKRRVCTAHGTEQAIGSVIGKSTSEAWDISLNSARRICFAMRGTEFQEWHTAMTSCSQDQQKD